MKLSELENIQRSKTNEAAEVHWYLNINTIQTPM
jgi:hypothetical protein